MRILHLVDRLSRRGGADQHLRDVVRAQRLNHRVTVAFGSQHCREPAGARAVKVRGLSGKVASAAGLQGLASLLDDADVVHVHNVMNPVALEQVCLTGRAVVTVQDHRVFCPGPGKTRPSGERCTARMTLDACAACFEDDGYAERTLKLTQHRLAALRQAQAVVVLSNYMAAELAAEGVSATVIPPWVDVADEVGDHPREAYIVGGRLVRHKAPGEAVQAWKTSGTDQPLRVAGAGPLAVEGLNLGWLPREALHRELRQARALLFPCRWQEPFGILGLEALAQGTPVVAWDRGGVRDWAGAGCLLVDGPEQAAEAISRLDADPQLRFQLGAEGQALAREGFGRAVLLARLADVYDGLRCREPEMEES